MAVQIQIIAYRSDGSPEKDDAYTTVPALHRRMTVCIYRVMAVQRIITLEEFIPAEMDTKKNIADSGVIRELYDP
jgi:hypothetical protein